MSLLLVGFDLPIAENAKNLINLEGFIQLALRADVKFLGCVVNYPEMFTTFWAGLSCPNTISLSCRFLWPFRFFRNSLGHKLLITIDTVVIHGVVLKATATTKV